MFEFAQGVLVEAVSVPAWTSGRQIAWGAELDESRNARAFEGATLEAMRNIDGSVPSPVSLDGSI